MIRAVRQRNGEAGSAMVEFALSAVLLLTVLFGILYIGRALYTYNWVSNAARLGTRFAMVRGTNCSLLSGGCPAQASDVTTYLDSVANAIDTSQLTVITQCFSSGVVQPATPPCAPTEYVQVNVTYNFSFLSSLVPFSWTMHSSSERIVQN